MSTESIEKIEKTGFFPLDRANAVFVILQVVVYALCFTPIIMSQTIAGVNLTGWVIGVFPVLVSLYSLLHAFITKGENRN